MSELVGDVDPLPADGDLAELGRTMRFGMGLVRSCIAASISIIGQRVWRWFDHRIMHSFYVAWAVAGIGWGAASVGIVFSISILG